MKLVTEIGKLFKSVMGGPKPLDRSKLVGIYLSSANGRGAYLSEIQENRTRRNGKYSHHRERA